MSTGSHSDEELIMQQKENDSAIRERRSSRPAPSIEMSMSSRTLGEEDNRINSHKSKVESMDFEETESVMWRKVRKNY